jgi:hypothetical protein
MLPEPGAPLESHNVGALSQKKRPSIRLTPTDPKIFGYVENAYFGPDMTATIKFDMNDANPVTNNAYLYSNRNMNSVKGERRRFFVPDNYAVKQYGVRANGLQFYGSIPIYRMTISDAIDVAKKSNGVIFCNKTPVGADPRSVANQFNDDAQKDDKLAAFEIVWIDKIPDVNDSAYNEARTKTVTVEMFETFKRGRNNDLSQLNYKARSMEGAQGALYESQDIELSNNLFMNLLRLSLKSGRTSGVISYLGGGKHRTRRSKKSSWTQRKRRTRGKKTRKN